MNIMWLKYAQEVAKTGSITKAAENLYMGQPNLSRAIKELEESLGISVFKRTPRGIRITPEGEEFLRYADKVLKQIDEIEELYAKGNPHKQRFSISVPRASYISDAFSHFVATLPRDLPAEIFYKETNSNRAIYNILHADYRLGIIRYASNYDKQFKEMLEEKGLTHEMVAQFRFVLIMHRDHPLAKKEEIRYADLPPYVEIAHADPYVPSLPLSSVKKEELPDNISRRIFVFERASQFELLAANPDTFMWVSPVPRDLLDRYGLVQRTCADNTREYRDVLVYRRDDTLTDTERAFVTELCKSRRTHLPD